MVLEKFLGGVAGTVDSRFCGVSQVYVEAKKAHLINYMKRGKSG